MSTPKAKPIATPNANHHKNAAECCDKAAEEHRHAAKYSTAGNQKKAIAHAKNAQDHRTKAQEYGKRAMAA